MNAANGYIEDNAGGGSDSDTNSDDLPGFYQPISSQAEDEVRIYGDRHRFNVSRPLPYGSRCLENGVLSVDLSDEEED